MKTWMSWLLLFALFAGGCSSEEKKRKERLAFFAGQRATALEFYQKQQQQAASVTVIGEVRQQTIPWTEGLTLAQALLQAQYFGRREPRQIIFSRRGETVVLQPQHLHHGGGDELMEPGDVVELRR